jgi:hypothetical protein
MSTSPNLALPFIEGGELLPDVTLNETLRLIDTLVQLAILDRDLNTPPGSPSEGQRWIVKASPSPAGAWAGHGNHVAAWQDGDWVFCTPQVGWIAFIVDEGALVAWSGSAWVDALAMLSTLQNITLLGVGTTADSTNPFSAKLNNTLWVAKTVAEGGDGNLRYKLSKESAAKTLSLLMQTNFSGRAEIGLTGDDNLHVKVSPDGSSWVDALVIDKTTGKLTIQGYTDPIASRALLSAAPFDALAFNGLQVNGGMEVTQENGTSSATLTGTGALQTKYLVDGVMAAYRGTFVAAGQQVTDAPAGYRNSVKLTVSTAQSSLGSSDELSLLIPIEGVRASRLAFGNASAASVSLAFWVKAHRTGTYSGSLRNSAKNRAYPFSFTVSAADTWEFKTVTVAGDTTGTWLNDTGVGLSLAICVAAGTSRAGSAGAWAASDYSGVTGTTNGVAATSDTFQLTGVVVLPGIELPASDRAAFIVPPYDQALAACRRYFNRLINGNNVYFRALGQATGTTSGNLAFGFPVMRASPSFAISSAGHFSVGGNTGAANTCTALSLYTADLDQGLLSFSVASGLAAGNATILSSSSSSATMDLSARL